ncbi:MAG: class I SAM-dependent methyltransferase [Bacteroidota bacterium]
MILPESSRLLIGTISSSRTDELLRDRGFDLLDEYLYIINEARLAPGLVVELATGTGRAAAVLARLGFTAMTGDITAEKRADAIRRVGPAFRDRISMILLNMECLPFRSQSLQSIVCLNTIHELKHPQICLSELQRVTHPDGTLVVGDFNNAGFRVMQEMHTILFGKDHSRGKLPIAELRNLISNSWSNIQTVETPLNVSFVCRGKTAPSDKKRKKE